MARHDPSSMSQDGMLSVAEPVLADSAEATERSERLDAQLKTSERLNEYYIQVVAELRASLDRYDESNQAS